MVADLDIIHAHILTMDGQLSEFADGRLVIHNGQIIYVGEFRPEQNIQSIETLDASGRILMPPFFNAHNHAPMALLRGLGNDVPLQVWLEKFIWPVEKRYLNPELIYLGTLLAGMEMIQSGTSIFADMYFFEDEVAQASLDLGMRCILGEGILDFPTPNAKSPDEGLAYANGLISKYQKQNKINFSIPAHAPYTCSREVLERIAAFARSKDLPVTIHLAETEQEVADHISSFGISPTRYLAEIGFFDHHAVCYHCNYLSQEDIAIFRDFGVAAVTLPNSNGKLASGIAPLTEMIQAGVLVALGTDGAASNNNMSMLNDLQLMLKFQKVKHLDPKALTAKQALQIATGNGAKAYRLDQHLGSLETGKSADCILIDTAQPNMQPLYDPYAQIAYSMYNRDVESVIIDGEFVMKNRQLTRVNQEEILREARKAARHFKW